MTSPETSAKAWEIMAKGYSGVIVKLETDLAEMAAAMRDLVKRLESDASGLALHGEIDTCRDVLRKYDDWIYETKC